MRRATLSPEVRAARDGEIARRWLAGETQARLGQEFGLTGSGIHRILERVATGWTAARADVLAEALRPRAAPEHAARTGRRPVWPDCPPELHRQYNKIRSVIGSVAAKAQLLALHGPKEGSTAA